MASGTHRKSLWILSGVALLLMTCCAAAQDVRTNYLPGTDFSKYKTYKWVRIPKAEYPNQLIDNQIMTSIDAQLATKGLTKTDDDNADLYIGYQFGTSQEKQWNSFSSGGGPGWWGGWGGYYGGMGTTTTTSSTITTGMIDVDIYDRAAKKLVWDGRASKTLNPSKNQQKNQKRLDKAMAKLFKEYPPKQS
jgi:hypothetical protein